MVLKEIKFSQSSRSLINKFLKSTGLKMSVKDFLDIFNKDLNIKYINNNKSNKSNKYVKKYWYENKLIQRVTIQTKNHIINANVFNDIFDITELRLDLKNFNIDINNLIYLNENEIINIKKINGVSEYILLDMNKELGKLITSLKYETLVIKKEELFLELEYYNFHYNVGFKSYNSKIDLKNKFFYSFIIEKLEKYNIFLDGSINSLDNLDLKLLEMVDYV